MALIDRAELFNRLSDKWGKAELYAAIQGIPEVDAEPVRHGHWIPDGRFRFIREDISEEILQMEVLGYSGSTYEKDMCSVCRKVTMHDDSILYDFCPHCGARMDGASE